MNKSQPNPHQHLIDSLKALKEQTKHLSTIMDDALKEQTQNLTPEKVKELEEAIKGNNVEEIINNARNTIANLNKKR